jgi:hypothetical protein
MVRDGVGAYKDVLAEFPCHIGLQSRLHLSDVLVMLDVGIRDGRDSLKTKSRRFGLIAFGC